MADKHQQDFPVHPLGPTTAYLLSEIARRNIPYKRFYDSSLLMLGYGCHVKKLRTAVTDATSGLGIEIAGDKDETKQLLQEAHIPVPRGLVVYSENELRRVFPRVRPPVVIKPLDGNHGRGVTTNITDIDRAIFGYDIARDVSNAVIIEEFLEGDDYRFLVINYKLIAVAKRTPAKITGDGKSTIGELIDAENKHPDRGDDSSHVLAPIRVDAITRKIFSERKITLEAILPAGEVLYLKDTANISAGGTADDVTDQVHPENVFLAERVARLFNLDICGIDIIAKDISVPLTREIGGIIEVNAGPGLRMHTNPTTGTPRDVAGPIIDMLFPDGETRIPVVAVAGNKSEPVTQLVSHLAQQANHKPGWVAGDSIYLRGHKTCSGEKNCEGNITAVLFDPTVDFAVLEYTEEIPPGPGFSRCTIGIFTGLENGEALAQSLFNLVPETGYAVLNADDDNAYELSAKLKSNVVLYSATDSDRVHSHCEQHGWGAVMRSGRLVVYNGLYQVHVEEMSGLPGLPAEVVLPALVTATVLNFDTEGFAAALQNFER